MFHINRSGPAREPKSTLPKASAPDGKGKAEASSSAAPASGINPKEVPLAGYLLARAALNRKIEDPVLKNLRDGHATVREVSDLLSLGPANVRENLAKAKGERPDLRHAAFRKMQVAFEARLNYPGERGMSYNDYFRMDAAASQFAKTGTCDHYVANTTALHAAKLTELKDKKKDEMEDKMEDKMAIVAHAKNQAARHTWSEMLPQGEGKDGKPILHGEDIIMDGWCKENLAVLREDSSFARLDKDGNGGHLSHEHLLDYRSGRAVLARVEEYKARIEGSMSLQTVFHNEFELRKALGRKMDEEFLWDAQSAFHPDFAKEAGEALRKDAKHPALAEIHAVGAARSLGANIRAAVAEAPGVIAQAKEMFPRPEPKGE
jgi:hypothetical protein